MTSVTALEAAEETAVAVWLWLVATVDEATTSLLLLLETTAALATAAGGSAAGGGGSAAGGGGSALVCRLMTCELLDRGALDKAVEAHIGLSTHVLAMLECKGVAGESKEREDDAELHVCWKESAPGGEKQERSCATAAEVEAVLVR